MSFLFGDGGESTKVQVKNKLKSQVRTLEREIKQLTLKETALTKELSKMIKKTDMTAKAGEIVRLRAHKGKLNMIKGNMDGLVVRLQTIESTKIIHDIMADMTIMLKSRSTCEKDTYSMLLEFGKQNELMSNKQALFDEALDAAFDEVDDTNMQVDEEIAKVMQEIKIPSADTRIPAATRHQQQVQTQKQVARA